MEKSQKTTERLELAIAILIALVSLSTAVAGWRTANLGSQAGDLNHQGLVDLTKKEASANESWRQAYQEAAYARDYLMLFDVLKIQEASADPADQEYATQVRTYLLPGMEALATPLGTNSVYITPNGGLDIQKRFEDLQQESSDISTLDPQALFTRADTLYAEQRWLTIGTILLAISLFWLGLSQLSHLRSWTVILVVGLLAYLFGLTWSLGVEFIFFFIRRGG
jgi:hypothetical protein